MGFSRGSGGASMADKHYDELYRMVQQLSTEMGRRQQGITIVHGADSKCVLVILGLGSVLATGCAH